MAGHLEQRCAGIIGNSDGHRTQAACGLKGTDRVGSRSAGREADNDIVGADACIGHGLCASILVVLRAFDALNQCAKPASHREDHPVRRPPVGRRQLGSVLHADAARGASADINDAPATAQGRHGVVYGSGDGIERPAHCGCCRQLALVHRRNDLAGGPGVEIQVSRAELLGAHLLLWRSHRLTTCRANASSVLRMRRVHVSLL